MIYPEFAYAGVAAVVAVCFFSWRMYRTDEITEGDVFVGLMGSVFWIFALPLAILAWLMLHGLKLVRRLPGSAHRRSQSRLR